MSEASVLRAAYANVCSLQPWQVGAYNGVSCHTYLYIKHEWLVSEVHLHTLVLTAGDAHTYTHTHTHTYIDAIAEVGWVPTVLLERGGIKLLCQGCTCLAAAASTPAASLKQCSKVVWMPHLCSPMVGYRLCART